MAFRRISMVPYESYVVSRYILYCFYIYNLIKKEMCDHYMPANKVIQERLKINLNFLGLSALTSKMTMVSTIVTFHFGLNVYCLVSPWSTFALYI